MMKRVALVSNGDFRDSAGVACWPKQVETLEAVEAAFEALNVETFRLNPYKEEKGHGFVTTQAEACALFAELDPETPVVLVISGWVYAHHFASSMALHKAPILLMANFDGTWPGLVALLNHAGTFERLNIVHSRLWTDSFGDDAAFMHRLETWTETGSIAYPRDHIKALDASTLSAEATQIGAELGADILKRKRILGQMDPGCMGMLNAVLCPAKMAEIGMPVELLSQSDLLAEMELVPDDVAQGHLDWLKARGVTLHYGADPATELTEQQVLKQMKMYQAAGVIYKRYGLSAIGIPYQYGLVRCTSASDLAEGMLNNSDRPDIVDPDSGEVVNAGRPIVHFNEGDLGSAIPQVLMNEICTRKGLPPETTLHDVRWGDDWEGRFIWVFEISGAAPPAHFGGWDKTHVHRQPAMYFPLGGGSCSGVSQPGVVTWARFYQRFDQIGMDIGVGEVVALPDEEVTRRLENTTSVWPIANVHIPGYGRDELMGTHMSNHITICYGDIHEELAAVADHLGIPVNLVGAL